MKKTLIPIIAGVTVLGGAYLFDGNDLPVAGSGAPSAVGIVLTTGTNLSPLITNFSLGTRDCSVGATTTCTKRHVLYQGSEVALFLVAPENILTKQRQTTLANAIFEGQIYYTDSPELAETRLRTMIAEHGYTNPTILYE